MEKPKMLWDSKHKNVEISPTKKLGNPQQKWRLKCEKTWYFHGGLSVAMFDCQRVMG